MKNTLRPFILIVLLSIGCSDPCDDPENVECETGDVDMDGILNGVDTAPFDPCLPEDNLACPTGDVDMDGISNSEDIEPTDSCLPEDNLACPTGDLDNDGISNSEDSEPLIRCLPKVPDIALNIIGKWDWGYGSGISEFKSDGTYVDIESHLVFISSDVVSKTWYVENDNRLFLVLTNSFGTAFTHEMEVVTNECDQLYVNIFVGGGAVTRFKRV